jgi:membrane protein YqaA with SNARE-associated domain
MPTPAAKPVALAALFAGHGHHTPKFIHLLISFGLFGVFLVSIVDSSFVPLPIPGVTDILIIFFAAQKANVLLLVLLATAGSAVGGFFSYQVGQSGGMAFLEKHVPARIFKPVCNWMEHHAILAVALPALLPPPMPLSPFVLAAGALKMSRSKFMYTFTISRAIRHGIAAFLGVHYGRHVLRFWNAFSQKWATTILVVLWSFILIGCAVAFWRLYKTSRGMNVGPGELISGSKPAA